MAKKLRCIKCGHVWISKSRAELVTCPRCMRKIKPVIIEEVVEDSKVKIRDKVFAEIISIKNLLKTYEEGKIHIDALIHLINQHLTNIEKELEEVLR
ncbi:MAG: hypothetical protein DRP00_04880 [Candidatus Aenigmatarchaeota archaeon]|nr:MAG: hypothetical protein DRP00_04880 [Candidatus Aenigmarchaeota archaeon]